MIVTDKLEIEGIDRKADDGHDFFINKPLVYVSKFPESVFDGQVLSLVNYYAEQGLFSDIYLVLGIPYNDFECNKKKLERLNVHPRVKIEYFKFYPFNSFTYRNSVHSLSGLLLEKFADLPLKTIFHIREENMGLILSEAVNNVNFVFDGFFFDIRAASLEEVQYYGNSNSLIKYIKTWTKKKALRNLPTAKQISAVSLEMKKYVQVYLDGSPNISVISSLANTNFSFHETERVSLRKQLGLRNMDTLFVFSSGGNAKWQNTELILKEMTRKGHKILNLSKEKIDDANVITRYVSYEEMPYYLSAADIAVIWRDDNVVNQVASPVKFSEYVCAGLPVISNRSVRLIDETIRKFGIGAIVDNIDDIHSGTVSALKDLDRKNISSIGKKMFGVEQLSRDYLSAYKKMFT